MDLAGTGVDLRLGDLAAGQRRQLVLLLDARYSGPVDVLVELSFDEYLSKLSDREFCKDVIARDIGASCLAVGFDFNFGKGRVVAAGRCTQGGFRAAS